MVYGVEERPKKGKLLDNKLSSGHFISFKNPKNIDAFVQTGEVEFLAQNGGFKDLCAQNIKNENLFGGIIGGFNKNLALRNGVGIQLKPVNI